MLAVEATRKVFEHFTEWMKIAFYLNAAIASTAFLVGATFRIRKYRQGRKAGRLDRPIKRIGRGLGLIGSNKTVARRNIKVGLAHGAIFWGFVALFIGTVILTLDYDIIRLTLGEKYRFFHGTFYIVYSFILDTLGGAYLVGLLFMAYRRLREPKELDYARVDKNPASRKPYKRGDWLFWHFLFWLGFGGFLLEALRILSHDFPATEVWSPIGWTLAHGLQAVGLTRGGATEVQILTWWVHAGMALLFIGYIPYSKAMHILTDAANLTFTEQGASSMRLPKIEAGAPIGISKISDFTWKELLDLDACTKCGRCHVVCPAAASGAPLSPRDVILDLRQFAERSVGLKPFLDQEDRVMTDADGPVAKIAGGIIPAETLWACTTCMACVEACPVGIEHVPTIVEMRRSLVDQGEMEPSLQDALQNIAQQGNSFGQSSRMRGKWTKELPFPVKDARKTPVDVLWFVGDYMSFDQRLQGLARSLATILDRAGVNFGILFDGERNSGNDVRRVGEEGLFEMLVEQNIKTLAGCSFREILTTDPHSLNTLRNEYPDFGGSYVVSHYTEFLWRMFEGERITPTEPLGIRATYHDPCYLARYNRITDAPRQILERLGVDLVEMPRNKENTFCCGAGGGRIWMDDSKLTERPSEQRIREAADLHGVTHFIVACPKDVTMYRDAVKTVGYEDRMEVLDIIELVERATMLEPASLPG